MNDQNNHQPTLAADAIDVSLQESWVSAFFDGEAVWNTGAETSVDSVHEQFFYYSVTRQILRGQTSVDLRPLSQAHRRETWTSFWLRVDHA